MTATPKPTCDLCGGPIQPNNKIGVCERRSACKREHARRFSRCYYAANLEKRRKQSRRSYAANRKKINKQHRRYYAANRKKIAERARRHYAANRKKIAERERRYRTANRKKIAERGRHYRAANREKCRKQSHRRYAAHRVEILERERTDRALTGTIPLHKRHGHLSPTWAGGENMPCSVPGCHRMAGWRGPFQIKRNKTGCRCSVHRYVELPVIKEEDYEYQPKIQVEVELEADTEALRSSVA